MSAGPLKAKPRRRGGSWLVSFALFAVAVAGIAVAVSSLSARRDQALAQPAEAVARLVAATPAAVRPIAARGPSIGTPTTEPPRAVPVERAATVPDFTLDALPVLETDGFDTGAGSAAAARQPAYQAAKTFSRRAAATPQR